MGARGPKPEPTVLRVLRGNPGRRPINVDEPETDTLAVAVPDELTGDPAAIAEWNRTIVPAIDRGHVTAPDRGFAIAHCELWATWRAQVAAAAKDGHVVYVGPNKHPMPNPARGMANKTFLLLAKVDAELGFTPSSRSKVKASPTARRRKSAVEAFMDRKTAKTRA